MRGETERSLCIIGRGINMPPSNMEVLAVTIFLSLCLAGFFVVMFLGSGHRSRHSLEQEALMPLDDEPLPHKPAAPPHSAHDS